MADTRPTKWAVVKYWAASPLGHEAFAPHLNADSPCCFACGWFSERWTEGRSAQRAWERATLERAHIVPAALGGSSEANNIILLCPACHRESPDWHDPWEMAVWISRRAERASKEMEHVDTWIRAAEEALLFKPALSEVAARGESIEGVIELMRGHARRAVVHGGELSQGTMAAILRATARDLLP